MTLYTALGLMSGTSLDGIDIALIETDGHSMVRQLDHAMYAYDDELRAALAACLGLEQDVDGRVSAAEKLMTLAHIDAVRDFGHKADLIGFHGQTIFHDPARGRTWQIGDGELLARETGMDVIYDFRSNDVAHGGQGAPLLPLYHQVLARTQQLALPAVILNIGGVANVTWLGSSLGSSLESGENDILAFDTGPGNALLNDWVMQQCGVLYDQDGALAASGTCDTTYIDQMLAHDYFRQTPPKSLDRNTFLQFMPDGLSAADGAATLTAMTVATIMHGINTLPQQPVAVYVTGGGRKNRFMMQSLSNALAMPLHDVETLGWHGDAIEAEGFAYLAVRSLLGLPVSLPTTTGCRLPLGGGKRALADQLAA